VSAWNLLAPKVLGEVSKDIRKQLTASAVTIIDWQGILIEDFEVQRTLSIDDIPEIVPLFKRRFRHIVWPRISAYAMRNRQEAVKIVMPRVEAKTMVSSPNSSNSLRLREVAERFERSRTCWLRVPGRSSGISSKTMQS